MQNQNMVMAQQATEADSAGNALNRYSTYASSTEAKVNDLKNATEQMWLKLVNSPVINSAVGGMTSLVKWLDAIVNSAKGSGIALVALSATLLVLGKNIVTVLTDIATAPTQITAIDAVLKLFLGTTATATGVTTAFTGALTGLKTVMTTLLFTPQGLAIMAIVTAIGLATAAIMSHINYQKQLKQETDDLTSSYKNLNQAMKDNDVQAMKDNYDKLADKEKQLQDLMAKRDDLENKLQNTNFDSKGALNTAQSQLNSVNAQIAMLQKELDGAGVSAEKLAQAQLLIKNNDIAENIKKQAEAESQNKDLILQMVTEYQNLNAVQDKNSTQRERMTQLANDLSDKISGLTLATDANGNVTIQNTDLLGKEVTMLTTEGGTVQTLTNVKLTAARDASSAQIGETTMTYTEIKKRISMYAEEQKALSDLQAQQSNIDAVNGQQQSKTYNFLTGKYDYASPMDELLDNAAQAGQKTYQQMLSAKDALDKIYNTGSGNPNSIGGSGNSSESSGGYIPEGGGSSSKSKSPITSSISTSFDPYTSEISSNNEELTKAEKNLTNLQNIQKNYSNAKDYQNALKTENQLLSAQNDYQDLLRKKLTEANSMKSELANTLNGLGITDQDMSSQTKLEQIYNERYGQQIEFANEAQKKTYEDNAKILKNAIDEWKDVNDQIDNVNNKLQTSQTNVQDINNDITTINDNIKKTAQDQLNNIQSVEDEIVKALKQSYQDDLDAFERAHQAKLDALNKQKSTYDDLIDVQEKALENEQSEYDYNKSLSDLESSKNDLQAQYNSLLLDNSDESKSQREDLAKQIADKETEIQDKQYSHSIDTQKSALEEQKSDYDDSIQSQIDAENTAYDNYKTIMDNKMKDENLYVEAKNALETQSFTQLLTMLTQYEDKWGQGLSATGDQIKSQLIDNLEKAQDSAKNLSNIMATLGINSTTSTTALSSSSKSSSIPSVVSNPIAGATYTSLGNPYSYTVRFDTGGYTGNGEGYAWLDKKEQVLNENDTSNILKTVDLTRQMMNIIPSISTPSISNINNNSASGDVNFHFDKLINVEGNATQDTIPAMQTIVKQVTEELKNTFIRTGKTRGVLSY